MESSKCSFLPQRVVIGVMGFLAIVVTHSMRACLSIAITEMVVQLNNTGKGNESLICETDSRSVEISDETIASGIRYNWTQEQQGWILSSFYIGYVLTHIPGAIVAQQFGGKWTLSLGIFTTAICTALTPIALHDGEDNALYALIILRILMGIAGGTSYPALSVLLAVWVPERERGKLAAFVLGGSQIGSLLSFYLSGLILAHWPWPIVFYFWSVISIVWFIVFSLVCYNDPASHPFISQKELDYLKKEMGQLKRRNDLPPTPWKSILTSVPVIAFTIAQVGNDWIAYVIASDLPKYMAEVLGFAVQDVGLYSSLPYLLMWNFSILSGFISDYIINKKCLTITQTRKIIAAFGGILPASFILAASYAGCDRLMVVICFTLAMGFMGTYYPSLRVNSLDLSPNYSGSLMALTNGVAAIAGIIVPIFIGMMTPDSSLEQWRFVFWVTFGIAMLRTVVFSIWASAEVQPWNEPEKYHRNL